ncbi:MAG: hypothetical protein MUO31_00970 [Thermodesulfovibrionales bacterium]|nr:hypothetical protein [Thermodesulfovibrionales bacterium]
MVAANTEYGYSTQALFEIHAKRDYGAIDAVQLADANIEFTISDAEVFVSGYCGHVWTGTTYNDAGAGTDVPKDITLVTNQITKIYLDNFMIERGIGEIGTVNAGVIVDVVERFDIMLVLEKYRSLYNLDRSVFISKYKHTNRSALFTRRPTGWQ